MKNTEKIPGTKAMAQRIVNAENDFVENIVEQFEFSPEDAKTIFSEFVNLKLVKLDVIMGRYQLKDGRFWDKEVMQRIFE